MSSRKTSPGGEQQRDRRSSRETRSSREVLLESVAGSAEAHEYAEAEQRVRELEVYLVTSE
jgi:hypothetical protein